jgi:hypothetical protein
MAAQSKTISCAHGVWTAVSNSIAAGDKFTLQVQDWRVGSVAVYVTCTDGAEALAAPGASTTEAIFHLPASGGFITGTVADIWPGSAAAVAPTIRVYPVGNDVLIGVSHG